MYYTKFLTPFCEIILAGDDNGLAHLHLETGEGRQKFEVSDTWERNDDFFNDARRQVEAYCTGKLRTFKIKIHPRGTDFQKRVWRQLSLIPYGTLWSYKAVATAIGNENACRAVGMANSKNPLPLIVPCHRVVGADGRLTGFASGLAVKERLINHEKEVLGRELDH